MNEFGSQGDGDGQEIRGRMAWQQAIKELLGAPGAVISMYSPDFSDWPLNQADVIAALDAWGQARRQPCVRMLARHFDVVQRDAPRFAQWRTRFAHLVVCHVLPEEFAAPQECLLLRNRGLLALPSQAFRLGSWCSGARLHAAVGLFDQVWQQSEPGFPAQALGL
ncbi:hypothetical protein [Thiomonas delicata]|uniref:DUF7931 domain-containing protein n=1 Tax=Thiomonas delicata TaxID=364030 RepID=A0A238D593_THIDL|nr:hypothetical protein [Thiomonas delicata]SBP88334.1 conserved hypothetical protein [Thiomonas delicata]